MADPALYFSPDAVRQMREAIGLAGGNEVFFVGRTDGTRRALRVEVAARGNEGCVPAILDAAGYGDMVVHNHPSGPVRPSDADLNVASTVGNNGVAFLIVDNAVSTVYCVVEPPAPRQIQPIDPKEAAQFFAPGGPLARSLPGYEPRSPQMAMLERIVEAFNGDRVAVIEAGTGTGKTFTYLYPAILWSRANRERCVISTNTINLQEQLVHKDIPLIRKALDIPFKSTLVKGRSNYVCLRKLQMLRKNPELIASREADELAHLVHWAEQTQDGSRADLSFIPSPELWERVQSETETSFKARCPHYAQCFYYRARRAAAEADLLVVNHHLLFSDLYLKEKTGRLSDVSVLPPYRRVILDEAHHLEETATEFFSRKVSREGIEKLLGRLYRGKRDQARGHLHFLRDRLLRAPVAMSDSAAALEAMIRGVRRLEMHTGELFESLHEGLAVPPGETEPRESLSLRLPDASIPPQFQRTGLDLDIKDYLKDLHEFVTAGEDSLKIVGSEMVAEDEDVENLKADCLSALSRLKETALVLEAFFFTPDETLVKWLETEQRRRRRQLRLYASPLNVGPLLARSLFQPTETVVLTSATLSTAGSFSFYFQRTGLDAVKDREVTHTCLPSPFDYKAQALMGIATDAPDIAHAGYEAALAASLLEIIHLMRGRTLVLFTSYRVLDAVTANLEPRLAHTSIRLLKQGTDTRTNLLNRFINTPATVLLGTDSFWEGIDVIGPALECVVLVKLPFRAPTDPVIQARIEDLDRRGVNSFAEYSLPLAVIKFKQGFGRLIRHKNDRGLVFILDRRVLTRAYGQAFLESIPECRRITGPMHRLVQEAGAFLRAGTPADPA